VGEEIEVMLFDGRNLKCEVTGITDEDGNSMEAAPHPKQKIFIALEKFEQGDITQGMILRNRKD
jgi:putative protease